MSHQIFGDCECGGERKKTPSEKPNQTIAISTGAICIDVYYVLVHLDWHQLEKKNVLRVGMPYVQKVHSVTSLFSITIPKCIWWIEGWMTYVPYTSMRHPSFHSENTHTLTHTYIRNVHDSSKLNCENICLRCVIRFIIFSFVYFFFFSSAVNGCSNKRRRRRITYRSIGLTLYIQNFDISFVFSLEN